MTPLFAKQSIYIKSTQILYQDILHGATDMK